MKKIIILLLALSCTLKADEPAPAYTNWYTKPFNSKTTGPTGRGPAHAAQAGHNCGISTATIIAGLLVAGLVTTIAALAVNSESAH